MSDCDMPRKDAERLFIQVKLQVLNGNQFQISPRNMVYWAYGQRDQLRDRGHPDLAKRLSETIGDFRRDLYRSERRMYDEHSSR